MLRAAGLFVLIFGLSALAGGARAADRCGGLSALQLPETSLDAASEPPGFVYPPTMFDLMGRPPVAKAFCHVRGTIEGRIRFEVWLPEPGAWNGRLQGLGNGGMAGATPYPMMAGAVAAGFAAVGSDLGHQSGPVDSDWAVRHPERVVDWGYRATHEMTVRAKAIVAAYYGRAARWSYFYGCSGGGRQGMMEAQRFPGDYDGIVAGDPTMNFVRLTTAGRLWMAMALFRPGATEPLSDAQLARVTRAATAECDPQDGVADGVIEDPRACRFDPARLRCRGAAGGDCLSEGQVAALRRVYAGPSDARGGSIFPGYERGSENGYNLGQWAYAAGFLRGIGFEDPAYDPLRFDFRRDVARLERKPVAGEPLSRVIDAGDPDLSGFRRRGGKLIHYHGWNDPGVPPQNSTRYYEAVVARRGEAATRSFYRLFMVPGMGHCVGGPGADRFDMLAALQAWVETGRAPARIAAAHVEAGRVVRTRPLCPYPERAVWDGRGERDKAESFRCLRAAAGPPGRPPPPDATRRAWRRAS